MNAREIIKKVKSENRISQLKLAEMLGVSTSTISAWENGRAEPPFSTIVKMLEILNYRIVIADDYYEDRSKRTLDGIEFDIYRRE